MKGRFSIDAGGTITTRIAAIFAVAILFPILLSVSTAGSFPLDPVPVSGDMTMIAARTEKLGLRPHRGRPMYGLELNQDYVIYHASQCGLEAGVVEWGNVCTLTITAVNDTDSPIRPRADQDQHWMEEDPVWKSYPYPQTSWHEISDSLRDADSWLPGQERVWVYSRTYAMEPGTYPIDSGSLSRVGYSTSSHTPTLSALDNRLRPPQG